MTYIPKWGVTLRFSGDHRIHDVDLGAHGKDVEVMTDNDTISKTILLDEYDAIALYFDLLEIIPQLRKDRG